MASKIIANPIHGNIQKGVNVKFPLIVNSVVPLPLEDIGVFENEIVPAARSKLIPNEEQSVAFDASAQFPPEPVLMRVIAYGLADMTLT